MPNYRRVRGKNVPVYDFPECLGRIERFRGTKDWIGSCWVPNRTIFDMLSLLPNAWPLYIAIHERRVGRTHWINGLTLQISHPAFE